MITDPRTINFKKARHISIAYSIVIVSYSSVILFGGQKRLVGWLAVVVVVVVVVMYVNLLDTFELLEQTFTVQIYFNNFSLLL